MSSSNQVLQIIQGPQLIHQQRPMITNHQTGHHGGGGALNHQQQQQQQPQQQQQIIASQTTTTTTLKQNKVPQQILPKPAAGSNGGTVAQNIIQQTTTTKTVVTQAKTTVPVQPQQIAAGHQSSGPHHHHHQLSQQLVTNQQVAQAHAAAAAQAAAQGGQILLPTGHHHHHAQLNAQPLLLNQLNQMPVLVQQNTPQGVQLILRPQTPQLTAAPSLVIHNSRPQHHLQPQPQPQQLLRILNTNGAMQLCNAAAPTFIVSSQANLIQQNLQTIKTNTGIQSIGGHHIQQRGQPQLAATFNSQILGQSVANLQLNGNLTQIQMPNGLNGQFISQLPSQAFQTQTHGFNAAQLNLNQLTNQNLSQIAAAAAAAQSFQSPPPQDATAAAATANVVMNAAGFQTAQFAQPTSGNVTPIASTTPQPHIISSPSPVPVHNQIHQESPISFNSQPQVIVAQATSDKIPQIQVQPTIIHTPQILSSPPPSFLSNAGVQVANEESSVPVQNHLQQQKVVTNPPPKKPKKSRTKKNAPAVPIVPVAPTVVVSPPQSPPQQATGKFHLKTPKF